MGLDRALIALSQSENALSEAGMARSGRSRRRFAPIRPANLIRDLERIWDVPGADLDAADDRTARPRVSAGARGGLPDAGTGRRRIGDFARLARCLGDESKVVRRAAAEALRLMGNRFNGSHRPGETPAQVRLVAELSRGAALRRTIALAAEPRGSSPPTSASCRKRPRWSTPCSNCATIPIRSSPCRRSRACGAGGTGGRTRL